MKKITLIIIFVGITSLSFAQDYYNLVSNGKLYGYTNEDGELTINYKYEHAGNFYNNLAEVKIDGKYYLIDKEGNEYLLAKKISDLTEDIEALDLASFRYEKIPDTVFSFSNLKILRLEQSAVTSIPDNIKKLKNLIYLSCGGNYSTIEYISKEIIKLKKLKHFSITTCNLSNLPNEVYDLNSLEYLSIIKGDCKDNEEISIDINQLINLRSITIYGYDIPCLKINKFKNLIYLDISNSIIDSLIIKKEHINLKTLRLSNCYLSKVPDNIGNLEKLQNLNLSHNNIERLSEDFHTLKKITYLDLSYNKLIDFSNNFENIELINLSNNKLISFHEKVPLNRLEELNLSNNKINEFNFIQLAELKILDLRNNELNEIPENFENIQTLEYLYLSDNKISDISNICRLVKLKFLSVNNNKINSFPKEVGKLSNLNYLYVKNNELNSLPKQIGKLSELKELHLDNNNINSLPIDFFNLKNLSSLNLSNNNLLTIPAEIGKLINLRVLSIENNKITSLPAEIGLLKNMTYLFLSNNNLKEIPEEFCNLKKLSEAGMDSNKLRKLPNEINKLKELCSISLSGNKLRKREQKRIKKELPNCYITF